MLTTSGFKPLLFFLPCLTQHSAGFGSVYFEEGVGMKVVMVVLDGRGGGQVTEPNENMSLRAH